MLIKPNSSKNTFTFAVLASVLLLFSSLALLTLQDLFIKTISGISFITGIILLIAAFTKWRDVQYRFSLTLEGIVYFTSKGGFTVPWEDIQRIDIPNAPTPIPSPLPYIGIRLSEHSRLLQSASLPLLARILIQQRGLTVQSYNVEGNFGASSNMLFPKVTSDKRYTGLQKMFYERMQFLHNNLGYDLYFPLDDIDREPLQFVRLLRNLKQEHMSDQYK